MGRKWANIVAKKTAKDGANSKVYAKFGVEIYVAAKKGDPDPETNSALKFVIDRAKQAQVPKHIIDKAIDKAKGNTDETFVEGRYEGFGPNGSMLIVDTLTSNVNRTAANVRSAFGKNGGNMGASGSVSYLFDNKGVVVFAGDDADSIFELLLEADVEVDDVEAEEGTITVYTAPTDLHKAIVALKEANIEEFQVTELEMIPQSEVVLEGDDLATFEKLYDALEDDEDVQKIYTNVDGFQYKKSAGSTFFYTKRLEIAIVRRRFSLDMGRPRKLEMRASGSWFSLYPTVRGTVMFFKKVGDKNCQKAVFFMWHVGSRGGLLRSKWL